MDNDELRTETEVSAWVYNENMGLIKVPRDAKLRNNM